MGKTPDDNKMILFYAMGDNSQYFVFSAFSPAAFYLDNKWWMSVEHYYQANKFEDEELIDEVRLATSPQQAHIIALKYTPREDWDSIKYSVMDKANIAKFKQNKTHRTVLLSTRNIPIHENPPNDEYWGYQNGGQDMMGKSLMNVRARLREEYGLK